MVESDPRCPFYLFIFKAFLFVFDVDRFQRLCLICYDSASVLCLVLPLKVAGTLAPQPGFEPIFPASEGEVLSTGPPGSPPDVRLKQQDAEVFSM